MGGVTTSSPMSASDAGISAPSATHEGYIQTADLKRAHRVAAALDVGNIWVNGFLGIPTSVPFGGVKQSGWVRLGGRDGIGEFTRPKNIHVAL